MVIIISGMSAHYFPHFCTQSMTAGRSAVYILCARRHANQGQKTTQKDRRVDQSVLWANTLEEVEKFLRKAFLSGMSRTYRVLISWRVYNIQTCKLETLGSKNEQKLPDKST
jgi:hypothetical protein